MNKLLITLLAIASPIAAYADPLPVTANAILALYVAEDAVQRAIDWTICERGSDRFLLDDEQARQFVHVAAAVANARIADPNALRDFCEAAGER